MFSGSESRTYWRFFLRETREKKVEKREGELYLPIISLFISKHKKNLFFSSDSTFLFTSSQEKMGKELEEREEKKKED